MLAENGFQNFAYILSVWAEAPISDQIFNKSAPVRIIIERPAKNPLIGSVTPRQP